MPSTKGQVIRCKAAVAWEVGKPQTIEEVEVAPPKAGEVRIKVVASGICRSDASLLQGNEQLGKLPVILGHEGAGIVESVGEGVTSVKEGDHVIPMYVGQCYDCVMCKSPKANTCMKLLPTALKGLMADGTTRFTCKGKQIYHFAGCSTFSQYTVVDEVALAKVNAAAPLDKICLIGCGISTGYGAAVNTAKVKAGSTCAIFGLGGIGMAAVMGCRIRGAKRIIGIDINPKKFKDAKVFGVTECVNPKDHDKPIQEVLAAMTEGGCDYTFECIGQVDVMRSALEATHPGWGKCVVIGIAAADKLLSFKPFEFIMGKTIKGSLFGGWKARDSVPKLVEEYLDKKIMVDEFITFRKPLKEINEGFELMYQGKAIRTVLDME